MDTSGRNPMHTEGNDGNKSRKINLNSTYSESEGSWYSDDRIRSHEAIVATSPSNAAVASPMIVMDTDDVTLPAISTGASPLDKSTPSLVSVGPLVIGNEKLIEEACYDTFGSGAYMAKSWQMAASGGPAGKTRMPYMSWIFAGDKEKGFVSEDSWDLIKTQLQDEVLRQISEGMVIPDLAFEWFGWRGGAGLIACLDGPTQLWYETMISNITVNGQRFKLWKRGEQGSLNLLQFTLSDPTLLARSTDDIRRLMRGLNRSIQGRFTIVSRKRVPDGRKDVFTLMVDDTFALCIKALDCQINLLTERAQCRYSDWKGLDERRLRVTGPLADTRNKPPDPHIHH